MHKLQIKNMVCPRCVIAVENTLNELNIPAKEVRLGEVLLETELYKTQLKSFKEKLEKLGFELLDDKNSKLINQIKTTLIQQVQNTNAQQENLSELLSQNLHKDYSQLSKLFSTTTGITVEQFYILQKIEKVKELLVYDELSLKEIAFRLNYSSTAHLSAQFKKVTGLTPTEFKNRGAFERNNLDEI